MIYNSKQTIFTPSEQYSLIRLINTEEEASTKKHEEGRTSLSFLIAKYPSPHPILGTSPPPASEISSTSATSSSALP